jgi:transposase
VEPPPNKHIQLSDADILAVYDQGAEAVVDLVKGLLAQVKQLSERVEKLEAQASKNSRNSSKPSSSDGFGKRTKSLRRSSEKPSGGQVEHRGNTLEWREDADEIKVHPVDECSSCGASLLDVATEEPLKRQVFDIPAITLTVTEHHVEQKCCPHCGSENQGEFPSAVNSLVQYGARLKGMMVYLMAGQLLPSGRSCEVLSDLLGVSVSEGTLFNTLAQCHEQLEPIEAMIQMQVVNAPVAHFDETGLRINGRLWWLHVACTDGLTYYFVHPKRGRTAMEEMGVLPRFTGKAIHDGWSSYWDYLCQHFRCNAHHLRELQFIMERYSQAWAYQMSLLLVTILCQVNASKAQGQSALDPQQRQLFAARYSEIIDQGLAVNPLPARLPDAPKQRGRPKRSAPRNLLERLQSQQASILGFMDDFSVPFDNNQAERDLRMMKLKQKISGGFRSEQGARMFCRIRGYLSTLRKQKINLLEALIGLFSESPVSLEFQPE